MEKTALVLGAGMVGVSVALHLRRRGWDVVLVDRQGPGEGASFGNGGLIQREAVYPHAFPRAFAETVFHFEVFARDSADPPRSEDFRVLVGAVTAEFEDVAALPAVQRGSILDTESYAASQAYGKEIRAAGANDVAYPSVRHAGGHCIGAFRSRAIGIPHQERHLKYRWNGERVDRYFDYARDEWIGL